MGLISVIGKQLQHPKGMLGKALFGWMTPKTIEHARWTADLMNVQRDDDVLEVGFGNGANIALLAERATNGHVRGAEISKTAIEMASKKNARAITEGRVSLHEAPGGALPFDDGTFDEACSVATMYVIADPSASSRRCIGCSTRRIGGRHVPDPRELHALQAGADGRVSSPRACRSRSRVP